MRASEIITELSLPQTRRLATEVLRKAGWEELDSGWAGTVYKKDGQNYILKLFDATDTAYLAYIELAQANRNPHFPLFFGKTVKVTPNYYAIRTEYLAPYKGPGEGWHNVQQYLIYRGHIPEVEAYMSKAPKLKAACDLIIDQLLSKHTFVPDVSRQNVMTRGPMMVLTDPVATPGR